MFLSFFIFSLGISLESAVKIVVNFSKYRIPEPTRQADVLSRLFIK